MAHLQKLIYDNQQLKRQISQYKQVLGVSPYVDDNLFRGGYRVVKTIEERDKIGCCHRKQGMKVVVIGEDLSYKEYVLKSENCKENIWLELDVAVREEKVLLTEDYSELEEDLLTQQDLNLVLKQIILDLNSSVENKLDKPVMTNNYYGLWDDTNKEFTNGLLYIKDSLTTNIGAIQLYNSEEGEYWRLSPDLDHNFFIQARDASTFFNVSTSSFSYNNLADYEAMFSSDDITSNRIYVLPDKDGTFIVKGYNDVAEVEGDVKANSYKFTLPTSITPTPNTLVSKTDGSRPIWYNNSSVANDLAFTSDVANKLDKPTMTNNYYGLWDDSNKKFVNGNLRFKEVNNEKALLYDVPESSDTASLFQIGGINRDSELPTDKCVLRLGKWDNGNSFSATCKYETSNNYDGFYSILTAGSNVRAESLMQALYIDERDSSLKQAYIATRMHPNYTPEIKMYTEDIFNISNKAGALLTYFKANNYWDFNVPIKVKDSLRFTLPTIITPTPNTLVPKTDGSGLLWYDNNSVLRNIGENFFSADLSNTTARNHTMNAGVTVNTLGNPHTLSGLPNKNTDIANFRKVRVQNTGGLDSVVDSKNLLTDAVTSMTDAEKDAWRTAQRKTGETYSIGQPRVDFVFPAYIDNSLTYVQPLVLYGINLYIDNQTPNSIVRLNRVEDINGNAVNDLYDVTNFEVSPLRTNQIVLMLDWSLYPKGKYKFKVINNNLQSLVSDGTLILNDTVPNVISNLTWQINTNPSQAQDSSFLNISNKSFSYERRISSSITEPTHTMISNETLTGNFVVELTLGLGQVNVEGGAAQNVYNFGLIAESSASTSFALSVLNGFEFKWEWDYGGVNVTDKGYFKDKFNLNIGSGGKIYYIKFQGYITICFITNTGNLVYLSSAIATTEPMKLFNSFYNQGRFLGKTVNFSYGQIFTY